MNKRIIGGAGSKTLHFKKQHTQCLETGSSCLAKRWIEHCRSRKGKRTAHRESRENTEEGEIKGTG